MLLEKPALLKKENRQQRTSPIEFIIELYLLAYGSTFFTEKADDSLRESVRHVIGYDT